MGTRRRAGFSEDKNLTPPGGGAGFRFRRRPRRPRGDFWAGASSAGAAGLAGGGRGGGGGGGGGGEAGMEAPGERAAWLAAGAAGAAGGAWLWYRALGPGRRHSAGTRAADVRDMASGLGGLSRKQTGERMEKHKQFFYAQVRSSPPCLTSRLCLPAPWSARAPARCSFPLVSHRPPSEGCARTWKISLRGRVVARSPWAVSRHRLTRAPLPPPPRPRPRCPPPAPLGFALHPGPGRGRVHRGGGEG